MSRPIRVLVVDDHAIVREGICSLLARHKDIQIIGQAEDGQRAIELVSQMSPDIILMDIQMPGMNGLDATREIHRRFPRARVLVLTQYENKEYVLPLLRAGAVGYIPKSARANELIEAIRTVYTEGAYLPPRITQTVVTSLSEFSTSPANTLPLTEREIQVLRLVAEGLNSREIAERLNISVKTVDTHRANIMEKLDVHNTAELIKVAIQKGLVSA
ncbi:MAG: response regulator transcription factor [Anaerolineae bacterium]|nr:response regulator transcription factor [Anaerolineae bacterium]